MYAMILIGFQINFIFYFFIFRYMKDNFEIKIESYHIADRGNSENVHQLPPEKLKCREVVHIDIAKVKI